MHMPCGFFRVGFGRLTGMLFNVASTILESCRLAPSMANPIGTPSPSVSKLRLTPSLARSVGLGPIFFPAQRCLGHRAVDGLPCPIDTFHLIILPESGGPKLLKNARRYPFLKSVMRRTTRTNSSGIQGIPLATCSQHEENGVQAHTVIDSWSPTSETMRVLVLRQQWLNLVPQLI